MLGFIKNPDSSGDLQKLGTTIFIPIKDHDSSAVFSSA